MGFGGILVIAAVAILVAAAIVFVGLWLGHRAAEAIDDVED